MAAAADRLALQTLAASGLPIELPLATAVRRIFGLTMVPVLAGMALRAWARRLVQRIEPAAGHDARAGPPAGPPCTRTRCARRTTNT